MALKYTALFVVYCAVACDRALAASIPSCTVPFVPPERLVDLSYSFNNRTIFWDDNTAFQINITRTGSTDEDWYQADNFLLRMRGGTHMDAPIRFSPGKWSMSQIPPERLLFLPIALVDVEKQTDAEPDYELSLQDIERWEKEHGQIPDGALVIGKTGRSKLWANRGEYLGIDEQGRRHFPTFSTEAARFLVVQRNIYGVGLDSPSVGPLSPSATHRTLSAHGVYKLENLADLSRVPAYGAAAVVLPIKLCQASGGPVRVVAILP